MKNISLFCFLVLGWCSALQAQENSNSYRLELSSNSIFPQYERVRAFVYGWDSYIIRRKYNYAIRLSAFRQLNPRLELGLGIGYANLDAIVKDSCYLCTLPIDLPKVNFPIYGVDTKFRAFEIPLELRINWFKAPRKIAPYLSVGLTGRMFTLYGFSLDGEQTRIRARDFSLGGDIGLGSRFYLTKQWSLNVATHVMRSKYYEVAEIKNEINWLNEWSVNVGASKAF